MQLRHVVAPYLQNVDLFAEVDHYQTRPNIPPCPHCGGEGEYFTETSKTGLFCEVINIRCKKCTYQGNDAVVIKPYTEQILLDRWNSGYRGPMTDVPLVNRETGKIVPDKINRTLWHKRQQEKAGV